MDFGGGHVFGLFLWLWRSKGLFEIVVAVAVQSVFRLEIHQNNIFFIFNN